MGVDDSKQRADCSVERKEMGMVGKVTGEAVKVVAIDERLAEAMVGRVAIGWSEAEGVCSMDVMADGADSPLDTS